MKKEEILRKIPSVEEVANSSPFSSLLSQYPRRLLVERVRDVLQQIRKEILAGKRKEPPSIEEVVDGVSVTIKLSLRKVVNATGVILHTNLGRAPLSEEAISHLIDVARGYSNLELNLSTGKRGSRYMHVVDYLLKITGAEDAFVVNNNAAAVFLALNTLSRGKEVIVWRGELIEIGGSFRLPEIMSLSGARLKEVGTTNKVYLHDYEEVISEETGLLMKTHPSNFRIVGFTHEVTLKELVELGEKYNLPVLYDAGSGALVDFKEKGFSGEPTIQEAVEAGVSIITFSGDKLLGGPQAGIVVGKKEFVEKMKKNHLNRALRIDKLTLAALESTLVHYFEDDPWEKVPALKVLSLPVEKVEKRARILAGKMEDVVGGKGEVAALPTSAESGGGALPAVSLPSFGVSLSLFDFSPQELQELLRKNEPPIISRVENDRVIFDLRTIFPGEEEIILQAVENILQ
jgi:L-seryl-tRNA(Ser) seleniumtransferase